MRPSAHPAHCALAPALRPGGRVRRSGAWRRRRSAPFVLLAVIGGLHAPVATSAPARATTAPGADFPACIDTLRSRALAEGIDRSAVDAVLDRAERLDRVLELDRSQPEFSQPFGDYLARRVTQARVSRGRELLEAHGPLLERVAADTGVPPRYLVAFWGLETNFGSYMGDMPVPATLTTLACDPRRSGFFTEQLFAAMRIVEAGDVTVERMAGSWAGAMGHVQFMPTTYRRHAVDGDGDGRADLWDSLPDAFASAGRFLQSLGWERGWRWGREVLLPDAFDHGLAGRSRARPLAEWRRMGVTDVFGRPLPARPEPAAILLPSGHRGPAFAVYGNFDVIMGWNRSESYALSVGLLADRIAGAGGLRTEPPREPPLARSEVKALQARLNALGYAAGEPDGLLGPATRSALRAFQRDAGLVADGHPAPAVLEAVARAAGQADDERVPSA